LAHVFYAEGKRQSESPRDEDRPVDLAGSDVILLEENEAIVAMTDHLNALHALAMSLAEQDNANGARRR
jgi:hypothetical protein